MRCLSHFNDQLAIVTMQTVLLHFCLEYRSLSIKIYFWLQHRLSKTGSHSRPLLYHFRLKHLWFHIPTPNFMSLLKGPHKMFWAKEHVCRDVLKLANPFESNKPSHLYVINQIVNYTLLSVPLIIIIEKPISNCDHYSFMSNCGDIDLEWYYYETFSMWFVK